MIARMSLQTFGAFALAVSALSAATPAPATAQRRDSVTRPVAAPSQPAAPAPMTGTPNRDVVLEIPALIVDSIGLTVADLQAHVSLDAAAMNLVSLSAGVDVDIKQVRLDITGVRAEAYLYIDLDNVARIVGRVIQSVDRNPQIATQVLGAITAAPGTLVPPRPAPATRPPPR
jgi:hypothetical protein